MKCESTKKGKDQTCVICVSRKDEKRTKEKIYKHKMNRVIRITI